MKKIVFILFMSFLFVSCNDNDESNVKSACGVKNPVEDLAWLKNWINQREKVDYKYEYMKQTVFEQQDVFIYGNCDPLVDYVPIVYNCIGEEIGYVGDGKFPNNIFTNGVVIWKSKNSKCDFLSN